jgi:hypothetical protein
LVEQSPVILLAQGRRGSEEYSGVLLILCVPAALCEITFQTASS